MHTGAVIMQVFFRQPYCQEASFCRGQWLMQRHTTSQHMTSEKYRVLSCRCFVSTHHPPWRLGEHHGKEERMQEPMDRGEELWNIHFWTLHGICITAGVTCTRPIQNQAYPNSSLKTPPLLSEELLAFDNDWGRERVTLLWEHGCWLFAHVSVANDTHVYVGSVRPWVINKNKEISWQGDGVGRVGGRYW